MAREEEIRSTDYRWVGLISGIATLFLLYTLVEILTGR
jgi:hypothetical protein